MVALVVEEPCSLLSSLSLLSVLQLCSCYLLTSITHHTTHSHRTKASKARCFFYYSSTGPAALQLNFNQLGEHQAEV
jgi:hypothetical protein